MQTTTVSSAARMRLALVAFTSLWLTACGGGGGGDNTGAAPVPASSPSASGSPSTASGPAVATGTPTSAPAPTTAPSPAPSPATTAGPSAPATSPSPAPATLPAPAPAPAATPASGAFEPEIVTTAASTDNPGVARLAGGGNVVTWVEGGSVRARLTDAAGALVGNPFTVGSLVNHPAGQSVTPAPDGGFLVLWIVETERAQSQFSGTVGIRAKRFSATGTALWETVLDAHEQIIDRVMARATPNGFVFGWTSQAPFTRPSQGNIALLGADGAPVGSPFSVSQTDGARQLSVAPLQDGSFLAVWRSEQVNRNVYTRRFDAALVPFAPGVPVPGTESAADVSAETLADGNVGLAWSTGGNEVRAAVLSPLGTQISGTQVSATRLPPSSLAVLPFGTAGFGVAWQILDGNYRSSNAAIWLRHFALAGTALDEPVQVEFRLTAIASAVTGASVSAGSGYGICGGPDGHFVAAFQQADAQADTYLMGR